MDSVVAVVGVAVTATVAVVGGVWALARSIYKNSDSPIASNSFVRKDFCDERHRGTENELKRMNKKLHALPKIEAYVELQAKQKNYTLPEDEG